MSYWPILPTPLVGEYHVKGVRPMENCMNRTIRLGFAELFLRLVNYENFPFISFVDICDLAIGRYSEVSIEIIEYSCMAFSGKLFSR